MKRQTSTLFHGYMNNLIATLIGAVLFLAGCQTCRTEANGNPMNCAYRHLLDNWASGKEGDSRRGYNIAAVLVNPDGKIEAKALNTVLASQDCTAHAEMLLIQKYIQKHRCFNLKGYTVYTTLEPCAMCTMALSMAGISAIYYGQTDLFFGKTSERMMMDTAQLNGYAPYPRVARTVLVQSPLQKELEMAFSKSGIKEITRWLATDEALLIIEKHLRCIPK